MIKWVTMGVTVGIGLAFAAGAYVGWKTTLKITDSVYARKKAGSVG